MLNDIGPTVNNMKITDRRTGVTFPSAESKEFKIFVEQEIRRQGIEWRPRGVTAAVLIFESGLWITKKHEVRKADADNRIKATFDSISQADPDQLKAWQDETVWELHVYKLVGRRNCTHVWLFDIGDVVDARPVPVIVDAKIPTA